MLKGSFIFLLLLTGCTASLTTPPDFTRHAIHTNYFEFVTLQKDIKPNKPLRIYIEGNGTPTPKKPTMLSIAKRDKSDNVIYITRPCQYEKTDVCNKELIWTSAQFNEEIINEQKAAIEQLIRHYKPDEVELIGYDGGGTMALLLATRLKGAKIKRVITIAGIVNTNDYAKRTKTDLSKSLNPANETFVLAQIPQIHYVGKKDDITPTLTATAFVKSLPDAVKATVKTVSNVGHDDWDGVKFDY